MQPFANEGGERTCLRESWEGNITVTVDTKWY